jgi:hypothetical protein
LQPKHLFTGLALLCIGGFVASKSSGSVLSYLTFHGTKCVEYDDGSAPEIIYVLNGAFSGNWSNAESFICPITRLYGDDNNGLTDVWLYGIDQNSSNNMSCYIRSCDYYQVACSFSAPQASTGTGNQQLPLGSIPTYPVGAAAIGCTVPSLGGSGYSGIYGYHARSTP